MKSKKYILGLGLISLLSYTGCKDNNDEGNTTSDYNRVELLANYSANIILPSYADLESKATQLKEKTDLFIATPTSSTLIEVRESLLQAQLSYQACSPFEFGPANDNTLRSILSTYPTSETLINQNIVSGAYDLYSASNIAAKGFPAVDYLLYDVQKTDQDIIDAFTTASDATNRKDYLLAVVEQVLSVVKQVNKEWVSEGYQQVFENSNGTAVGSSTSLFLNALVLDFERFIRDGKIGIPAGVRSLGVPNPEKVEAYYSQESLPLVKKSIEQYKRTFNGTTASGENQAGFDDYLKHEGAATVATKVNTQLDLILSNLNALNGPLSEDVVNNKIQIKEVYDEMQKAIVLLKVEMPSALSVLITYQDSDGD